MPYDAFKDSERYVSDTPNVIPARSHKREQASAARKTKPHAEWTINDVVTEFRQRYILKYPMHSPDDLGNFQRLASILGKNRRDEGITIPQMITAIDTFFRKSMGERYPEHPAWKKYLWMVRDQRNRNPEVHANTMRKSAHQGTIKKTALTMEALLAGDPEAVAKRRAEKRLASKRQELEHWLDEQRRHGDWVLEEELGQNWAIILEELMKEVGYERPGDPSGGSS